MGQIARERLGDARVRLAQEVRALGRNSPQARIANNQQQVDELSRRLEVRMAQWLALRREALNGVVRHLAALNPEATLARGYAIVREKESGRVVKKTAQIAGGKEIEVRVSDGEFEATTKSVG
jgi:exodeoxyribonuclease VII large subunit